MVFSPSAQMRYYYIWLPYTFIVIYKISKMLTLEITSVHGISFAYRSKPGLGGQPDRYISLLCFLNYYAKLWKYSFWFVKWEVYMV